LECKEETGAVGNRGTEFNGRRWDGNDLDGFFDRLLTWLDLLLNEGTVGRFRAVET